MKQFLLIAALVFGFSLKGLCQLNVELLHQLVAESKDEFSRQDEAKNKQAVTTANEEVNKSQMSKLKAKYRDLQNRFRFVGLAIDAAQIGVEATPIVNQIIRQQSSIFSLAQNRPVLIPLALGSEVDLSENASRLAAYIAGLALSIGDLNQMKASDRKILFGHVLNELKTIENISLGLLNSMINANSQKTGNPFSGFINRDKELADQIKRNLKQFE